MPDRRIASRRHPAVAAVALLRRGAGGAAVAEGPHLAAEALAAGWQPVAAFATERWAARPAAANLAAVLRRALAPGPTPVPAGWFWVPEAVMEVLAGTATPQGLVAVFAPPPAPPPPPPAWTLVLDGVQDPGNVGALARCLFAFGGPGSLLLAGPDAAHPFGDRALRASAGAAFHLRHERAAGGLPAALSALPVPRVALCPRGGTPLPEADLRPPLALVVGGEGGGLRPEVASLCRPVTIPLRPGAESLNVACAAAVALYAAAGAGAR